MFQLFGALVYLLFILFSILLIARFLKDKFTVAINELDTDDNSKSNV